MARPTDSRAASQPRRSNIPSATIFTTLLTFLCFLSSAVIAEPTNDESATRKPSALQQYKAGDPIPVSCLNRTIDTGEHIEDEQGRLQYVPFPTCEETGKPLELYFGVEKEINCTLAFIDDTLFHLLEFYIHNDAPLTCRIPSRPMTPSTYLDPSMQQGVLGSESSAFTPIVIALSGILQRSHLHIANSLNVLIHAAPKAVEKGVIDAATAYSVGGGTGEGIGLDDGVSKSQRVKIGDSLTLRFSVRWFPDAKLPPQWQGVGGHLTFSTLVYCLLSAGASAAVCIVYFRGVELPRRLRRYGRDKLGGVGGGSGALPRYSGYGYGVGTGQAAGFGAGNGATVGSGWGYPGGGTTGKID